MQYLDKIKFKYILSQNKAHAYTSTKFRSSHNLHIIVSNSLMGFKVICQLDEEPLTSECSRNIFLSYFFGD